MSCKPASKQPQKPSPQRRPAAPKAAKKQSLKAMLKEIGVTYSMSSPHIAHIPKTPENIEKLWRAGFPV
jgi:hypothetical protein